MKKTTALMIFIIYLASIIVIGFFGMSIKVYNVVKYVKEINMTVEAESLDIYEFVERPRSMQTGNKCYNLTIHFSKAKTASFTRLNGITMEREYVSLSLIPHVTYDTGDVANSREESVKYTLGNQGYAEKEYVSFSNTGLLTCFKKNLAFTIYVSPASISGYGKTVEISVNIVD